MPALPIPLLIVLATGLVSLLGGTVLRGRRGWAAFVVLGFGGALAALALDPTDAGLRKFLDWLLLGCGLCFAASLAGLPAHRRDVFASHPQGGLVPGLLSVSVAGGMMIGFASDFLVLIVGLELTIAPFTVLLLRTAGNDASRAAAVRFALTEVVGLVAVIAGAAVLQAETGTLALSGRIGPPVMNFGDEQVPVPDTYAAIISAALLLVGLAIRARLAPFHMGNDEVHAGSSSWTAGVLATFPRLAVAAFLLQALPRLAEVANETTRVVGLLVAVASILAGGIGAILRKNLRRVLAAATMAQFGLVFACAAVAAWDNDHAGWSLVGKAGLPGGFDALLLQIAVYGLVTTGTYAVLVHVTRPERPVDFPDDLTGLARTEPAAAASLTVLLFAVAGLPPFVGFWSRLLAITALASPLADPDSTHAPFAITACVVALGGAMVLAVFARWIQTMLFDQPRTGVRPSGGEPALAVAVLLAILVVGLGLLPGPLLAWIRAAT